MQFFNVASMMLTLFAMNSRATVGTSDKCFNGLKNRVPLIDNTLNITSNNTLRALEESSSSCPFGTHMITYSTTTLTSHSLIILIINIPVHYVRFIVRTTPIIYNNNQQQQKGDKKDRGTMFSPSIISFNDNDDDDNYEEDNDDDYDKEEKSPDNCYCDDEVDDDDDDDDVITMLLTVLRLLIMISFHPLI
mmetsp:Transcript_62891/g.70333  ORF Transcript_62891/g.70333 Transcript_62891/m.70333 type:complete len:191 (+) Transcript_62891:157-729(+)